MHSRCCSGVVLLTLLLLVLSCLRVAAVEERPDNEKDKETRSWRYEDKTLQHDEERIVEGRVARRHAEEDWEDAYKIIRLVEREKDYSPFGNHTFEGDEEKDEDHEEEEEEEMFEDNCTHPRQPFPLYNDSCDLVHAECRGKSELIDYLAFVLCDLPKAQVSKGSH